MTDDDLVAVSAQYGVVPDGGMFANGDITNNCSVLGDEAMFGDGWGNVTKFSNHKFFLKTLTPEKCWDSLQSLLQYNFNSLLPKQSSRIGSLDSLFPLVGFFYASLAEKAQTLVKIVCRPENLPHSDVVCPAILSGVITISENPNL